MLDPILTPGMPVQCDSAKARYEELLRKADTRRLLKRAGPAEAKRPLRGLATVLQVLRLIVR